MARYPILTPRDLDGFFGLFVDNLVQLLLMVSLCSLCGIGPESPILLNFILPGAAMSILVGNLFYALQAHWMARKENRTDVTALPYGINTPSLLVYVFFVMLPAFRRATQEGATSEDAAKIAWMTGLLACLGSGLIEFLGAFVAHWLKRVTPRAALLSTLAGIALGFISMTFLLQIYQRPLVAMLPLTIILLTYFARVTFPWGLPGGLIAILAGSLCAWLLPFALPATIVGPAMSVEDVQQAWSQRGWHLPMFAGKELWEFLQTPANWLGYLSVIIPMGLFNLVGSLQNLESAEAAGDRYAVAPSLAVNGIGTLVAAMLGSCFPTTIYIGHPGWKGMGARAGYSTLNGLAISAICLTGTVTFISRVMPLEAGVAIVLWIGLIITAQAFQATPKDHAPAVAMGFFPAIAAWGATIVTGAFDRAGGRSIQGLLEVDPASALQGISTEVNGFLLHALLRMERGFIFTCMILAAICVSLIERKFVAAAIWSLVATLLTGVGLMHAYQIRGNATDFLFLGVSASEGSTAYPAWNVAIGYAIMAIGCWCTASLSDSAPATSSSSGTKPKHKGK